MFLGTLEPRKDVPTLLRAFAAVRARHPGLLLLLVGRRGWLYEPIFAAIDALGLTDAVRTIEDADDEALPPLFDGATAFAYPSLYEGVWLAAAGGAGTRRSERRGRHVGAAGGRRGCRAAAPARRP